VEWIQLLLVGPLTRFCGHRNGPLGHLFTILGTVYRQNLGCILYLVGVFYIIIIIIIIIIIKIKQWMEKTKGREKWRTIVEEAKAHPGL
jgi:hypothetical protein